MKIIATYGIKYEPQWLVDDLRENLYWVDGFAEIDCRHRTNELWINESEYRKLMRAECKRLGADWILVTSPDERFEDGIEIKIRMAIEGIKDEKTIFGFDLKEMFSPTQYRTDGIWGRKERFRLYKYHEDQRMTDRKIQSSAVPVNKDYEKVKLDINLYHLKMIEPENRAMRARVFEKLDPGYKLQKRNAKKFKKIDPEGKFKDKGYWYFIDEEGMVLEQIPEGREFSPAYDRKYLFSVPQELLQEKL